jgi:crossover junction endodeoxyribonuclease RuvC
MIHFGIDVGCEGAIACLDDDAQLIGLADLHTMRDGKIAWTDPMPMLEFIREHRDGRKAHAWVEYVAPMPKLSVISAAGMGRTHGSVLATLQVAGIPFTMVSPQVWKRKLNLLRHADMTDSEAKGMALSRARQLFPGAELDLAKHHNRAEAALLAYHGRQVWTGARKGEAALASGAAPF